MEQPNSERNRRRRGLRRGSYAVTGDPQTSGIIGIIGSIVTGGATYALTEGKVFDKSGYGNGGTMHGDVSVRDGTLVLNGGFVRAPDSKSLDITRELTIEAVVNPEPATERQHIVDKHKVHDGGGFVLINRQDQNWIDFVVRNPEGFHTLRHRNDLPEERDNRIVCKFTESEISMELNGEVIESETPEINYIGTNELDLGIGARFNGNNPFRGTMRSVSISGR